MSVHPIKSFLFTWLFSLLGMCLGVTLETKCHCLFWPFLGVSFAVLWWYWFTIRKDTRKAIVAVLLAVSLFMFGFPMRAEAPPQKPEPAGYIIGVTVLVVAGYIIYILWRTCQRTFNRPPRPETNGEPVQVTGFAASKSFYYFASCDLYPSSLNTPVTAMELTGSFEQTESGLQMRLAPRKLNVREELVSPLEFDRALAEHGIYMPNGIGQQVFGRGGRPATQEEVPIYFWEEDGRQNVSVLGSGEPVTVAMERSPDLKHWETLLTTTVSTGQRLRFLDATASSQMFYRFRPL